MRILVTDGMDKTAMATLRAEGHEVVEQFYEPDQLGEALRDFDGAVVRSKTKVRANHIDAAKGSLLKLIMCLYVAIYLSLMGEKGLREVNEHSYAAAHYLHDALLATGRFEPVFDQPFLEEFCLRYKGDAAALHRYCADHGFLAGVLADGIDGGILFAATERRTKEETDQLVGLIEKFKEGGLK